MRKKPEEIFIKTFEQTVMEVLKSVERMDCDIKHKQRILVSEVAKRFRLDKRQVRVILKNIGFSLRDS